MPDRESAPAKRWTAAAIVLAAVLLRLAALADPPLLDNDEVRYLVAAHHLSVGEIYNDWRGPETHVHPLHPFLTSLGGRAPGTLELRGRLVALVSGILFLLPLAAIARRLGGPIAARILLLLLAVHPWLVRASVKAQPETLYVLTVAAAIHLLWPGHGMTPESWRWLLGGLLFGLSYLARPEGILVGLLAGAILMTVNRRDGMRTIAGAGLFMAALVLAAAPYLLFLRRETGEWVLTGKTAAIFFVGQAAYETRGEPPSVAVFEAVKGKWDSALPYMAAHPGRTLGMAALNAKRIWGWVVPRGLGLAGLLGLAALAALVLPKARERGTILLIASPCLTLFIMMFTFPNERVATSVLPFLLVLAACGLAALVEAPGFAVLRRRLIAVPALLFLAATLWAGPAWRAWNAPGVSSRTEILRAVALARAHSPGAGRIASDDPALSFRLQDPLLFGPAGGYRPLPADPDCGELAAALSERGAVSALLERPMSVERLRIGGDGCPIRIVGRLALPEQEWAIWVVAASGNTAPGEYH